MPLLERVSIVTLSGGLGAGKTTLVKEIFKQMGVSKIVTSPTFSYVNSYEPKIGLTVHHFDLYKISSLDQFLALGFDEYLVSPGTVSFIEWPEVISSLLTKEIFRAKLCSVSLAYLPSNDDLRELKIVL
jgi:tRNA threonylcarbamoyladenosine biosynthesis protein TsaE